MRSLPKSCHRKKPPQILASREDFVFKLRHAYARFWLKFLPRFFQKAGIAILLLVVGAFAKTLRAANTPTMKWKIAIGSGAKP